MPRQYDTTYYRKHESAFETWDWVLAFGLVVIPMIAQDSIDNTRKGAGSPVDLIVTVAVVAYCVAYACMHRYARHRRESLAEERRESEAIRDIARAQEEVLYGISELAERNALSANDSAHSVAATGKALVPQRGFDTDCKNACAFLCRSLNIAYGDGVRFEVSYDARDESRDEVAVTMLGYGATIRSERPSCRGTLRLASDELPHYDLRLFSEYESNASDGPVVHLHREEVLAHFEMRRKGSDGVISSSEKDYRQYIARRVICPATRGSTRKKMIGLLQVAVVGSEAWDDVADVERVLGSYIDPVASQLLLIHKLWNVAQAKPPEGEGPADREGGATGADPGQARRPDGGGAMRAIEDAAGATGDSALSATGRLERKRTSRRRRTGR